MPRVTLSPILEQMRGDWFDQIINLDARDAVKPAKDFVLYGMMMIADSELGLLYRRGDENRGSRVFVLLAVFSDTPTIKEVDLSEYAGTPGDQISLRLSDRALSSPEDVCLTLTAVSEGTIEQGQPRPVGNGHHWLYTTSERVDVGTLVRMTVSVD